MRRLASTTSDSALEAQQVVARTQRGVAWRGDDRADSGMRFKQTVGEQRGDDLVRGVGVDVRFAAECADRGERVSGTELAGDDSPGGGVDDLLADGDAGAKMDDERNHMCTITASTPRKHKKFSCAAKHTQGCAAGSSTLRKPTFELRPWSVSMVRRAGSAAVGEETLEAEEVDFVAVIADVAEQ